MRAEVKCKCGNLITVSGMVIDRNYNFSVDSGRIKKGDGELLIICEKCGNKAGRIELARQVPVTEEGEEEKPEEEKKEKK